jgi:phage FluMu protein Com
MSKLTPHNPVLMVKCPRCFGCKGIAGKSDGPYKGPATLPCPRCEALGEVELASLTEEERNPKPKPFYFREDNP